VTGSAVSDRETAVAAASTRSLRLRRLHLLAGIVVPVAAYVVLRHALHSETLALAITETIPVAWVLAIGFSKRRVDPIALVAAIVLGVALVVSVAMGGSALPLKLRCAVVTGSLGIACMASLAVRRPLLPAAIAVLARAWPRSRRLTGFLGDGPARQRAFTLTAIIGITLLGDAAAQVTLALSVSTTTFVGISRLARTAIFALGLGLCGVYVRRSARRAGMD
jgi:hypothetical protein